MGVSLSYLSRDFDSKFHFQEDILTIADPKVRSCVLAIRRTLIGPLGSSTYIPQVWLPLPEEHNRSADHP